MQLSPDSEICARSKRDNVKLKENEMVDASNGSMT